MKDNIELNENEEWTPIGNSNGYTGTFEGNGHRIIRLYVIGGDNCGLFGKIGTVGTVKNVSVSGKVNGSNYVGGIAGVNNGTVENCSNACAVKVLKYY